MEQAADLLLAQAGTVGRDDELDAVGDDEMRAHLDGAGPARRHGRFVPRAEQAGDGLERQPRVLPLADAQQVGQMGFAVPGAAPRAGRGRQQPLLDVEADRAARHVGLFAELLER